MPMHLSDVMVYPVKSAAGISVGQWDVDSFGLRYDRRWMVLDSAGRMATQRTHRRLALVRPTIDGGCLTLSAPGMPPLALDLEPTGSVVVEAPVWDDVCDALWLGPGPARWMSEALGSPCELVYMAESTVRPANPAYAPEGVRVSFADAFPFLVVSQASLADLNSRMERPLPMNRFRPNLVIGGGQPYVEDTIGAFAVDGITFRTVKPCDRCVVTTADQATTTRGVEPLRTLATYRKVGNLVMFGQNTVHAGTGTLRVGSPLLV